MTSLDWIFLGVGIYAVLVIALIGLGIRYAHFREERDRGAF